MVRRIVLVVGDKFMQFAAGKEAITVSQLCGLLSLPAGIAMDRGRLTAVPGQGLGDDDVTRVLAATSSHGDRFDLSLWRDRPRRASARLSHKRRPENTLISDPRRLADNLFELDLLIDEDCELMADHQTGQHVQGMVLMEAARQTFLAVTEAFFLPQDGGRFYFVINKFGAEYRRFAFPLDATILYRIKDMNVENPLRQSFAAEIDVVQCGVKSASFVAEFTAFEDARISAKEDALARDALAGHLDAVADSALNLAA